MWIIFWIFFFNVHCTIFYILLSKRAMLSLLYINCYKVCSLDRFICRISTNSAHFFSPDMLFQHLLFPSTGVLFSHTYFLMFLVLQHVCCYPARVIANSTRSFFQSKPNMSASCRYVCINCILKSRKNSVISAIRNFYGDRYNFIIEYIVTSKMY